MTHSPAGILSRLVHRAVHHRGIVRLAKFAFKAAALGALLLGLFALFCHWLIQRAGVGRLYTDAARIPACDVALVLGTSEKARGGNENWFFKYRINAAAELFRTGKARLLLVSGDNHTRSYDEPTAMRRALIRAGVPESAIRVDCAGFRTLDSIVRARKVFGLRRLIVVSQRFHNQRALFIAKRYGIDATGFCASDVGFKDSPRTYVREALARMRVVLDLYVFHTHPKFLGEKIDLGLGSRGSSGPGGE